MSTPYTIGRLATAAGVHVETVRYYQRRGLLNEPARPLGGVRRYGPSELTRLQFIRRAQTMGFTLDEVAGLLEIKGKHACEETRQLIERKLVEVRRKMQDLRQLEQDLQQSVVECVGAKSGKVCPTLDFLEHRENKARDESGARPKLP